MPNALFIPLIVLAGIGLWIGIWVSIVYIIGTLSGWKKLARLYPDPNPGARGEERRWVYGRIGMINYNGVLILEALPLGLRFKLLRGFNFGLKPILIPWTELQLLESATRSFLRLYDFRFTTQQGSVSIALARGAGEWVEEQKKALA